ncbi:MAG: hypothetical protein ACE5FG_14755 [Myxococcota bacterium]
MRRRGGRWGGRSRGGSNRLLDKVRSLRGLALRELRPLGFGPLPAGLALGVGSFDAGGSVVVVASTRDGLDLVGWAEVAARLAGDRARDYERILAAPLLSAPTCAAAARLVSSGRRFRLAVAPGLAEPGEDLLSQEGLPSEAARPAWSASPESLHARIGHVLAGATAVACCGELRRFEDVHLLYMRGTLALRARIEGSGVELSFMAPESRQIHVTDANFSRWGTELHESVMQLAQDPRLLDSEAAARERRIEGVAAELRARVTARWIPWNPDGVAPVEWAGVLPDGSPVLGVLRTALSIEHGPGLMAAYHLLEAERELWIPGSSGAPRLCLSAETVDDGLLGLLADLGVELESVRGTEPEAIERELAAERRGRRGARRRRRGRGGEPADAPRASEDAAEDAEIDATDRAPEEERVADREEPPARRGRSRRGRGRRRPADAVEMEGSTLEEPEAPPGVPTELAELEAEPADLFSASAPEEPAGPAPEEDLEPELDEERIAAAADTLVGELEDEEEGPVAGLELEAAQGEPDDDTGVEEEPDAEEEPAEDDEPAEELPRRRNPRAAIVAHADFDSILAALVLARDRRSVVSFRVLRQDDLMDFFRGPANDLAENVDLLLVGLMAQPTPIEVIQTAELFRGRLQWFDHHDWPIEDVERLRDAIGRNSILFEPGAASSLAAVVKVTERRSRFTDKLIDLAGRRLSESDMIKWGYRVVGLLKRLAANPGEARQEISPVLAGKPGELSDPGEVHAQEESWVTENAPRAVHFGEYQMVVLRVPPDLDAGEVGRRARLGAGARLSLVSREDDDLVVLGCNDEKRHINILALVDHLAAKLPWAEVAVGGDRVGRLRIEELSQHPERIDQLIGEIARNRSLLYG